MAIQLPHSTFFHVPKTGGMWVESALQNAGIPIKKIPCNRHDTHEWSSCCVHNRFGEIDPPQHFLFGFVRHPFSYYQSFWAFKSRHGWDMRNTFEQKMAREHFEDFVRDVTREKGSGFCEKIFHSFLSDSSGRTLDFVGRFEYLVDDLVLALRLAGENFQEDALRATPRRNAAAALPSWSKHCVLTEEFKERIYQKERWVFDTFGYTPEDILQPPVQLQAYTFSLYNDNMVMT